MNPGDPAATAPRGLRLLIAGGGTGGHLYPGIAVAEEVRARGGEVLFVGTTRGIEARVVPAQGYALELLEVSGLKRVGFKRFVRGVGKLPVALARSLSILRRFRPDVVLGVGGYASGPLVMAAALGRIPTAIQEQNSVPGFTNRVLGKLVSAVFTAFAEAAPSFPQRKVVPTGNPVRRAFTLAATAAAARGTDPQRTAAVRPRLLVVGGSQGARAVSDLVVGAMATWKAAGAPPAILHQTGTGDLDRVRAAYAALGLGPDQGVEVRPFIDDMVAAYTDADLVIARAGALTLAELAISGRPALLIPLPTAADDHQTVNAAAFAASGAARVLVQGQTTPDQLAAEVTALLGDPARLAAMAAAMQALARPDAAATVVNRLQSLAAR